MDPMKQNQSHPNDPTQNETCESADIQNNPEIHDAHAYEFTAIASHVTEGKNQAGIKLIATGDLLGLALQQALGGGEE